MKMLLAASCLFFLVLTAPLSLGATLISPSVETRIIGGEDASESYPWMVSIQTSGHFCGGVLIDKDWVLTAAHCLDDKSADSLTLYIGLENLLYPTSGDIRKADWFLIHPDYNNDLYYSDLAIIKLNRSTSKTPIPILNRSDALQLQQNEQMRILGWGVTETGSTSRHLKEVEVSYQSDNICNNTYPINSIKNYWSRSLCAGEVSGGKDSCQGDSGGPMIVKAQGEWALTGLVSWGSGCAEAGLYGVYSEVSSMTQWIEERLSGVTLMGEEKIGFVGKDRHKPQTYTLWNMSPENQTVQQKSINNHYFSIDENNWLLDAYLPSGSACDFTVNAEGVWSGEHDANLTIQTNRNNSSLDLNAKVLDVIDASTLDTDWTFYSGTSQFTEHSAAWSSVNDTSNGEVLKSGAAAFGGRSVLLTYLNGPSGDDVLFLKFKAKVDKGSYNFLNVFLNERSTEVITSGSWSTYAVKLDAGLNHVMFIYFQSKTELGSASINNLRVCNDRFNDATCSSANGYFNADDISVLDDPSMQATSDSVCRDLGDASGEIQYASRTSTDIIFGSGPQVANSTAKGSGFTGKSAAGSVNMYWLILMWLTLIYSGVSRVRRFK